MAEEIDYPRGLTFEKVWAMFQETDRKIQEDERKLQETMKENERKYQEAKQEADRRFAKTEKLINDLGKQMGGLHNSFGELAEHLVAPGVIDRFNEQGYHFDIISQRGLKIYDENRDIKTEVDMYLENGDCIMAVEIKADPKEKDIEHHIKRLEILREYRNRHKDTRKIRGAIAVAILPAGFKKQMLDAGLYILEQAGDTIKMDIPRDFVPRDW